MVKRIVSFLPSATELLYELGAQDMLYGVTHECLYPEDAKNKPRIINSVFDSEKMSSQEIDKTTCSLLKDGKEIFTLNEKNLLDANPDLIISQNTCEVCAAHTNQIAQASSILNSKPQIHSMDPHNINEILESIIEIAKMINKESDGIKLKKSLEQRIDKIKEREKLEAPKILALEWVDPLFTAGHWVPEMIDIAGGTNLISKTGEHSHKMSVEEALMEEPDIVILMPCGFNTERSISEYKTTLAKNEIWINSKAVKENKVFAVDANSYFSKPSIRTIIGIEVLSKIIYPEIFSDIRVPENSYKVVE